jgi:hypothetical protein
MGAFRFGVIGIEEYAMYAKTTGQYFDWIRP